MDLLNIQKLREKDDITAANPTLYYNFKYLNDIDADFYETKDIKLLLSFSYENMEDTITVGRSTNSKIKKHTKEIF